MVELEDGGAGAVEVGVGFEDLSPGEGMGDGAEEGEEGGGLGDGAKGGGELMDDVVVGLPGFEADEAGVWEGDEGLAAHGGVECRGRIQPTKSPL